MTKILRVPYIAELDGDTDIVKELIETKGVEAPIESVNWRDTYPDAPESKALLAHTRDAIYILFKSCEPTVRAVVDRDLGPVSSDSCFEFFIEPDKETRRYWNFEFNAVGRLNASYRVVRPEPTRFDDTMLSTVKRVSSLGDIPFDEQKVDEPWTLTVRIPFVLLGVEYKGTPIEMRGNIYKCASDKTIPHYLSWSPIHTETPDFHRPEFFGTIVFE